MTDILDNRRPKHCFPFNYTALGNSIAFGEGASFGMGTLKNYGYVYYFRDFLDRLFNNVMLRNHAIPGFTSSTLLNQLQTNVNVRESVKNADLITISIGGGDLLECLNDPVCLSNAVVTFSQNWKQILKIIRKDLRSKARILVMTIYNPVPGDEQPNFDQAEFFIQQINQVIKANRSAFRYLVVDVHDDFLGQFTETEQWKVCIWTHFCEGPQPPNNLPDPHPTDSGHLEIARLHQLVFLTHFQRRRIC